MLPNVRNPLLYEKAGLIVQNCKVAFVGSYSPRQCGIATFTTDLRRAISEEVSEGECWVVAVNDNPEGYAYPSEVHFEIGQDDPDDYLRAADFLNSCGVEAVCVQHEFGIYGGPAGEHLLGLLERLRAPVVTTLHTVLENPDEIQERVMNEVLRLSHRVVVMTEHTERLLLRRYEVTADKVDRVAHGIPDTTWVEPDLCKAALGYEGRHVLLTFGLLSPGKGIESVLEALPAIVEQFPEVVYIILGATHPNLVRDHGEAYRLGLQSLATELGVSKHVHFEDRFVDLDELTRFIAATDIYITPSLNEAQAVSGTLAYAFGCGKPVISTPYWHAKELLADGKGLLVGFEDSTAIAKATLGLLKDSAAREAMAARAYAMGRSMVWSRVAKLYEESFQRASTGQRASQ